PDPCAKPAEWAGLRSDRAHLRAQVAQDVLPAAADALFLDQDHPLLASWGRIGQHLMLALADADSDVRIDVRHWRDEMPLAAPLTRLAALQESIRHLDADKLRAPRTSAALDDASLRVHVCHTRLRELEVLRDTLLRARRDLPDLKPSEILVTAPDIHAYAPLIPAVFGEAGAHQGSLPYHLADVALARTHRLFTAFDMLLDLPQTRLSAPELMDLVDIPEVADALGLDRDDIDTLRGTLERTRIAWGFDGAHRASFGVPVVEENTFAWGMDRLIAGYVFGAGASQERTACMLPDGVALLPVEGIAGPQAQVVGALDRLLRELAAFRRDAAIPRRATQWAARLDALVDALLRVDYADEEARSALAALRRAIHAIEGEAEGVDPELDFAVMRDVLRERLGAVPERQRFLMGGVTFCGMVPQRAVPFRVIAVLGLDDGAFPRAAGDGGIDLMARYPRLGDRDVRNDDRWLFLETVMAARERLHLSYVGEGARDAKARNPAQPLAELMQLLGQYELRAAGAPRAVEPTAHAQRDAEEGAPKPLWLVRHPLQPFNLRYFDAGDARLFSFSTDLAALAVPSRAQVAPFVAAHTRADAAAEATQAIVLREILAYYKDPAKQLLRTRACVRLDAFDEDRLASEEPLDAQFARIERVARRIFLDSAANATFALPAAAPDWLRLDGLWPPGHLGEQAWCEECEKIAPLLDRARDEALFAGGLPPPLPLPIDRRIGEFHLRGELARAFARADARWIFELYPERKRESDLGFKERIGLFLEWALLRLDASSRDMPVRLLCLTQAGGGTWQRAINDWDARFNVADAPLRAALRGELEARVAKLLAIFANAQVAPAWYFPKASWKLAQNAVPVDIDEEWRGGFGQTGERDFKPGYARLLARDADFAVAGEDVRMLHAHARELRALIEFEHEEANDA
ncbi:MAG: exonuclease V subunit gamma, partial [Gammaproteobacteria bacterium]